MTRQVSSFPQTYREIDTETLLVAYQQGPARLQSVLKGLSSNEVKAHARPGKWSIQQIVLHVADSEIMGASRIRQTFARPGSVFALYDQDVWANAFDYRDRDQNAVVSALKLFEALRQTTSAIFNRAGKSDWQKSGIHGEHGVMTLRNLLELYADHSERHIEQILESRRLLDKSLDFEILLKERLY